MSVTMTKAEGVTVLTLTSDPQSVLPPICQILKGLCYNPVCCSVSQHLKKLQGRSQSVLGALQIMIGLLNIGLGVILCSAFVGSWMDDSKFPLWMGGLFILFGVVSIVSEKRPSPCLVILNVILNLSGVAFSIATIVLYSINFTNIEFWWMCRNNDYDYGYNRHTTTTSSPDQTKCLEVKAITLMLMRSINTVLIVLCVLEFCVVISSAILGIKALCFIQKREKNKSPEDPQLYKPLLEEVTSNPAA
ncbi:membrane-spanning 4-domains subfamily A member 8-like [Labrus mixtus]|uniref:membrane-spanning 4-domains subfamily A member 8-like n=1 Tax=Labrus mixtus TaxID=508554 RepID=UPI0029C0A7DD|nr:membrane-spanning 4-domains subfamily A member 8-like [Labrus mixtus]XP_060905932.1 membrane-spanning 4-domains subfamily A member 8-like [Labrus mixtus]XP_060905938.1 membrane-spanning 4-domains subfamily A member 8-like [Labrus mixtus]XP_060905939.1 membrane-spanning 4-domains subfamily A member 8-like [Labrus mixtus]